MLEVFVDFLCAFIFAILGFYIIKKIINYEEKISINQLLILLLNSISITIIHILNLNFLSSLVNFIINTYTYKKVFKQQIAESIIETGIIYLLIIIIDALYALLLVNFFHISEIQTNLFLYLICNIIIAVILYIMININYIQRKLRSFIIILLKKDIKYNVILLY